MPRTAASEVTGRQSVPDRRAPATRTDDGSLPRGGGLGRRTSAPRARHHGGRAQDSHSGEGGGPHPGNRVVPCQEIKWSSPQEIRWVRSEEIRWSSTEEIGWVRTEEILQLILKTGPSNIVARLMGTKATGERVAERIAPIIAYRRIDKIATYLALSVHTTVLRDGQVSRAIVFDGFGRLPGHV